ncbi:hypothetical protein L5876_00975 [Hyphobacterium sp. SN044]|uniref:hypothetical protein n=1 Tax=Hyphobacterium sp. SN044 TaxID=2912575 RepID=UPI001F23BB03|nr:hypothetical protein [Hyphobacterium sp. SN044]MCF8878385.1 hypothetical protein [Hyphobacterium sp. SN044]
MTRSFMLAVSGFALVSAACSPGDDVAMDETDTDETTLAQDVRDESIPETENREVTSPGGAQSMDSLRDELEGDEVFNEGAVEEELMESDTPVGDDIYGSDRANFGLDYAGVWGTEAQCANAQTWAISASSVTTPEGEVCSITNIEEGAGQIEVTGDCRSADNASTGERTMTLALQDDGSLSIMDTTDVSVQRCTSFELPVETETETEE